MFENYHHDPVPGRHTFHIKNVDLAIVNGLRRTILADIPVVGFHGEETGDTKPSFEVLTNTGRLHNEILMHRLGLLPLHLSEEETEAFAAEEYTFELKVKNEGQGMRNVTTHDFQGTRGGVALAIKEVHRMFPADPIAQQPILITRLKPGEEIHVRGAPVVSTARQHAGFMPVSLCTFSYLADPERAALATNPLDKERAYARNKYGDPLGFRFEIEPVGALSPRFLVHRALEVLVEKLQKVRTELFQDASEKVTHGLSEGAYNFTLHEEDDTLGFLLQSLMYNTYIRDKKETATGRKVTYVGYYAPHPLQNTVVLRIVLEPDAKGKAIPSHEYMDILSDSIQRALVDLQAVQSAWLQFAPRSGSA